MSTRLRSSTRASTVASDALADYETKSKGESTKRGSSTRSSGGQLKGSELARLTRIASIAYVASLIVMGGAFYLAIKDIVRFYPHNIKQELLKGFNSRSEYALRYQTLLYGWLLFNIHAVMYCRFTKKALNPLVDSTEKHMTGIKNILSNSFEQIFISSFLQFGFVSYCDPALAMKLIPLINICQFLGRIAFFFGYPLYRTFGFSLTITPNIAMFLYNFYKFGSYLGLY